MYSFILYFIQILFLCVLFTAIKFGGGGTTIQFCLGHPFGQQRPCVRVCVCVNILSYKTRPVNQLCLHFNVIIIICILF